MQNLRTRLTLAATLAVVAMGVGLSVAGPSSDVDVVARDAGTACSIAAAFPSVEAHFALRRLARS